MSFHKVLSFILICSLASNQALANLCQRAVSTVHLQQILSRLDTLLAERSENGTLETVRLQRAERERYEALQKDPQAAARAIEELLAELELSAGEALKENAAKAPLADPKAELLRLSGSTAEKFLSSARPAALLLLKVIVTSAVFVPVIYAFKQAAGTWSPDLLSFLPADAKSLFLGAVLVSTIYHVGRGSLAVGWEILGAPLAPVLAEARRKYFSFLVGGKAVPVDMRAFFRLNWWHIERGLSQTEREARNNMVEPVRFIASVLSKAIGSYRRAGELGENYRDSSAYRELVAQVAKYFVNMTNLFPEHFTKVSGQINPFLIDILQGTFYPLKLSPEGASLRQVMDRRFRFAEDVIEVALELQSIQPGQILKLSRENKDLYLSILKQGLLVYDVEGVGRVLNRPAEER